jgi:hypothetical protein
MAFALTGMTKVPRAAPETARRRVAPPPPRLGKLSHLLEINPRPLINPAARMVVIFSPKAACSNIAIWFFHHLGHGEQARAHDAWPHRYRKQIYYGTELYRDASAGDLSGYKVVRVIRDPYDRAASAFRHAIRTRLAERDIAQVLDDDTIARDGLSFADFLTFLERSDLTSCNPHFRIQRHPIEDVLPPDTVINISKENLMARLADVAHELGLPPAKPQMQDWMDELRGHNSPAGEFPHDPDLFTRQLTRLQAANGPWPSSAVLLTDDARRRLQKLYAVDIRSYLDV